MIEDLKKRYDKKVKKSDVGFQDSVDPWDTKKGSNIYVDRRTYD